ncbi:hypothetical protein [Burkholderia sp. WAC0059]|uniref:hypothetical protein n=1 Tax=Burkholderia sp. WAC0059 TaxID=2066022 RepID=UPI0015E0FE8B|nr:hypothetical protein [Burkholderia sp. WAC0059]
MNHPTQPQRGTPDKPRRAVHSDDRRSAMPERGDKSRRQGPADQPGRKPGEGEPPVG